MRGKLVTRTWEWDPTLYAPPKYRKACKYEAFIPEALTGFEFDLTSRVAGVVSDAEQAIMTLNASARPALALGPPAPPHGVDRVIEGGGDAGKGFVNSPVLSRRSKLEEGSRPRFWKYLGTSKPCS